VTLLAAPDPAPLARTLLRLRHDIVIVGRAAATRLPKTLADRLASPLTHVGERTSAYLCESAKALVSRGSLPPVEPSEEAFATYNSEVIALHREGLTLTLSISEVEQLFTLGFALEQLHRNFRDLGRCVEEAMPPSRA